MIYHMQRMCTRHTSGISHHVNVSSCFWVWWTRSYFRLWLLGFTLRILP